MADELTIDGLHQVALTTRDINRSSRFYRETLGLKQIAVLDPPGLAFFDVDGVRLSMMQNLTGEPSSSVIYFRVADIDAEPSSSVIYFRVADIDAAVAVLKQRAVDLEQEPELVFRDSQGQFGEAGEEEWMAFFRDPDGNLLALTCRKRPD
jgi:methylmalonyl-CoA/ethylmalonyl-CoA epimerase